MILAIDTGNTTIAIHIVEIKDTAENDLRVLYTLKLPVAKVQTPASLDGALGEMKGILDSFHFDQVIISSVVPELNVSVSAWAKDHTGHEPVFVGYRIASEKLLRFAIPHPEKLGADRICDAIGAAAAYELPVITVDLGSATTFNVVAECDGGGIEDVKAYDMREDQETGKKFLGGIIAPGIRMGMHALSTGTSLLSETDLPIPDHYIGKDTQECMLLGTAVATAAMIDGMVERIEEELGRCATLVITGGNAVYAAPYIRHAFISDSDLLIKGMCVLAEQMVGS